MRLSMWDMSMVMMGSYAEWDDEMRGRVCVHEGACFMIRMRREEYQKIN